MQFPLLIEPNVSQILPPWAIRGLIGCELAADSIATLCLILLWVSISRASAVHLSFRLINLSIAVHYFVAMLARCIIMYYQWNGIPIDRGDLLIFTCDVVRDHFVGFFVSELAGVSFERFVATHYWRWYERRGSSTLLVFLAAETIAALPSLANVLLCEFDVYTHVVAFVACGCFVTIGGLLFVLVVYYNVKRFRQLRHFTVNYSVSEGFQVKENLALTVIYFMTTVPIMFAVFLLLGIYFIGLFNFPYVVAVDLAIAIYAPILLVVTVFGMPEYRKQLTKIGVIQRFGKWINISAAMAAKVQPVIRAENAANAYFSQFAGMW